MRQQTALRTDIEHEQVETMERFLTEGPLVKHNKALYREPQIEMKVQKVYPQLQQSGWKFKETRPVLDQVLAQSQNMVVVNRLQNRSEVKCLPSTLYPTSPQASHNLKPG